MLTIRRSRPEEGERVIESWRSAVDATHDFLAPEDRLAIDKMFVVGDIERARNLSLDLDALSALVNFKKLLENRFPLHCLGDEIP